MTKWTKFPHPAKAFVHDAAGLKQHWARLHRGDCEPFPKETGVIDAWRHYHAGDFGQAIEAGLAAGGAGINAAVKAQTVYAHYLEKADKAKLSLFEQAAGWADERRGKQPKTRTLITFTRSRSDDSARKSPSPRRWRKASVAKSRMPC
jgi:hypothetical protein